MDKTLAKELDSVRSDQGTSWKKEIWQEPLNLAKMRMSRSGLKNYNLLTAKPVIYAANVSEDDLADDGASNAHVAKVREHAQKKKRAEVFVICAQIEQEIAELDDDEKKQCS